MAQGPRPKGESVLGAGTVQRILIQGTLVAAVGVATYLITRRIYGFEVAEAHTAAFIAITTAQLLAISNARTDRGSGFVGTGSHPWLWGHSASRSSSRRSHCTSRRSRACSG